MYKILAGVGSIVRTLFMVFTHGFRKRDTILYPEVPAEEIVPPRYRGRIILTRDPDGEERCVACNLCAVACPVGCISLQKLKRRRTLVSGIFPYQLLSLYLLRYVRRSMSNYSDSANSRFRVGRIRTSRPRI